MDLSLTMQDTAREERRSETCEVFTPQETVRKMLDKLPDEMFEASKTFLDNSCGNGNMLVEVLMKKLEMTPKSKRVNGLPKCGLLPFYVKSDYVIDCVKSLYGTDMMEDNVKECKERIFNIAWKCINHMGVGTLMLLDELQKQVIDRQIICTKMEDWDYERWCPIYEKLF